MSKIETNKKHSFRDYNVKNFILTIVDPLIKVFEHVLRFSSAGIFEESVNFIYRWMKSANSVKKIKFILNLNKV